MTCYCLCCTAAFLICSLVLETFIIQAETSVHSLPGAELQGQIWVKTFVPFASEGTVNKQTTLAIAELFF